MTRERISRTLELREILLSFQTGSNLVNAAVSMQGPVNVYTAIWTRIDDRPDAGLHTRSVPRAH